MEYGKRIKIRIKIKMKMKKGLRLQARGYR